MLHHNRAGLPPNKDMELLAVQFHPETDGLVTVWMSHGDTVTNIQSGMIYGVAGLIHKVVGDQLTCLTRET